MRIAKAAEEDTVLTAREATTTTTRTTTMSRTREGGLSRGITNPISESHTFVNCEVNDVVKQKMYFKTGNWEK